MRKYLFIILFVSCSLTSFTQSTSVPFTLEDRDRIIRTEAKIEATNNDLNGKIESLRNEMNTRFESMDTKFESMNTKFESMDTKFDTKFESINVKLEAQQKQLDNIYILLFFILGAVFSLIGFVIWDRRTALKPVQREQETILKVLKDYSKKHIDLSEILKKASVL